MFSKLNHYNKVFSFHKAFWNTVWQWILKMQEQSDDVLLPQHPVTHTAPYPCLCIVPSHVDSAWPCDLSWPMGVSKGNASKGLINTCKMRLAFLWHSHHHLKKFSLSKWRGHKKRMRLLRSITSINCQACEWGHLESLAPGQTPVESSWLSNPWLKPELPNETQIQN